MHSITVRIEFDAGHRLLNHEGKCRYLHGHRYAAELALIPLQKELDDIGRVIDFGVIKSMAKKWIDQHWDHNLILNPRDPLLQAYVPMEDRCPLDAAEIHGRLPFIMPEAHPNPTAENMAVILGMQVKQMLVPADHQEQKVDLTMVRLYETPNCFADFHPDFYPRTIFLSPDEYSIRG